MSNKYSNLRIYKRWFDMKNDGLNVGICERLFDMNN